MRALAPLLLALVILGPPARALDYHDYRRPSSDRSPVRIEEIELSRSQREDLCLLLVGLARNHGHTDLSPAEGAMALALASEIDPQQPALVQSWRELPEGVHNPVHAAGNLAAAIEQLEIIATELRQDQLGAASRAFGAWLADLAARCRARITGEAPSEAAEGVDWSLFFPEPAP